MKNPIAGLIMGLIIGACPVLSGLTNPDIIIGLLRLRNFHVIRTIAVFLLVGMLFVTHTYILIYPSTIVPLDKIAYSGGVRIPQITDALISSRIIPTFAAGLLVLFLTISGNGKILSNEIKSEIKK